VKVAMVLMVGIVGTFAWTRLAVRPYLRIMEARLGRGHADVLIGHATFIMATGLLTKGKRL
jgi:hypothetical protein